MSKNKKRQKKKKRRELVENNPKLSKQIDEINRMRLALPIFEALHIPGVDNDVLREGTLTADSLSTQLEQMIQDVNDFNEIFSEEGWIIYDSFNMDVARQAINFARDGKKDCGQECLVSYYDKKNVEFGVMRCQAHNLFKKRIKFLELACDDYERGRYYACIPILLMIADGIICDIAEKSFSAKEVEIRAWDCFAGHAGGLDKICKIFTKIRRKTSNDIILIPYRNGILHGKDLNYANRMVAAKCWAFLFAIRDWAVAATEGRKGQAPSPSPEPTLAEIITSLIDVKKQMDETDKLKNEIAQWKPRDKMTLAQVPKSGKVEDYFPGTPERALVDFFMYWEAHNFGYMAKYLHSFSPEPLGKKAKRVRDKFSGNEFISFKIKSIDDQAFSATNITAIVEYNSDIMGVISKDIDFRLLCLDEDSFPVSRGNINHGWKIVELFMLHIV